MQRLDLSLSWQGKSYLQANNIKKIDKVTKNANKMNVKRKYSKKRIKKVKFKDYEKIIQLETSHNLFTQSIDPNSVAEYDVNEAIIITRVIDKFQNRVEEKGASYAQQFGLKEGIKRFKQRGRKGAMS